jgi:ABC-type multidrug transport system fused ATPase/permease subunit
VTKLNAYEENYEKRVMETRAKEVALLKRELAVWACTLFMTVLSPVLATAATMSVYVLVDDSNILTAPRSFTVLLLFAALRFPINYAGRLVGRAAQALSAVSRLARFLDREVQDGLDNHFTEYASRDEGLVRPPMLLSKAGFTIGDGKDMGVTVSEFTLSVKKGEVVAVCGPVGSGKSSLVNGVIGELSPLSSESKVELNGKVAIVPQTPFILNATLRDNILFGSPFDRDLYERVLDACQLRQDIEQLGRAGDLTDIGERGVTLSGGQKQRVSLGRAAYSRPDLVLLDDPLSALDSGTSKEVFQRLVRGEDAFFRDAAVVLVTHASYFLNRCDQILLVVDGKSSFLGTWDELSNFESTDAKTIEAVDHMRKSVQETQSAAGDEAATSGAAKRNLVSSPDTLMTVEDREHGLSSLKTWMLWFRYAGGAYFISILIVAMVIDRLAYVASEFWLGKT